MAIQPAGRGPEYIGVLSLFIVLTSSTIFMRAYCRTFIVKSFGWDDWFALIAYIFFILFCTFALTGIHHGTGQHAQDIPPAEIPVGLKWWWACEPVYVLSNMALKFSIGLMLLRLTVKPVHRIIIWVVLGVTEIYSAFFFLLFIFQCRPSAYFWTQYTGGKGSCINPKITVDATYGYSAITCLGDWTFAILPMFIVWDLQMNPRTKLSVALILALGAIASAATIVRLPYIHTLANFADFLYATTDVAIWSTIETGLGITACSIATLRPLFRAFLSRSKMWGSSSSRQISNLWPSNGYMRSRGKGKDIGLRDDLQKNTGVTTVIESDQTDLESGNAKKEPKGKGSMRGLRGSTEWSDDDTKLTQLRLSEENDLNWSGIRKTTVSEQVVS